jgi:NADH:ubiquinone oxidoreductase subunit F (NADH-binding)
MQPVSGQQLGIHVPAAMNTQATSEERCVLCGPCREVITRTVRAMSQLSSEREIEKSGAVGQLAVHLCNICQTVRTCAEGSVKIRYQETTSEDIEDFMFAAIIVTFEVRKPARLL